MAFTDSQNNPMSSPVFGGPPGFNVEERPGLASGGPPGFNVEERPGLASGGPRDFNVEDSLATKERLVREKERWVRSLVPGPGPPPWWPAKKIPAAYPGYDYDSLESFLQSLEVKVGTVCTGMATEEWSWVGLPYKFENVFWCEKDPTARAFLFANFGHDVPNWLDCTSKDFLQNAPKCNFLLGGFPCQPFSIQGKGQGIRDAQGRGVVAFPS